MLRELALGYATGTAGTAAMTATTALQKRMRDVDDIPVDYDATSHVVDAAGQVIGHRPSTDQGATALFLLTHWGYGSAMAIAHRLLVTRTDRPRAALMFYVGVQGMAFVLFPTIGQTPTPWRWRRDVLASSIGQHLVYVGVVSLVDRMLVDRMLVDRMLADRVLTDR